MEDVSTLKKGSVGTHQLRIKTSAISLKESAFFEYRWYRILEALHKSREDLPIDALVRVMKQMGTAPNENLLRDDLVRLEEQGYVVSHKETSFPPVKKFRLQPKGTEKVKRVLRK